MIENHHVVIEIFKNSALNPKLHNARHLKCTYYVFKSNYEVHYFKNRQQEPSVLEKHIPVRSYGCTCASLKVTGMERRGNNGVGIKISRMGDYY